MNFAYLYVNEYRDLQEKEDFFKQLHTSIEVLKKNTDNPTIFVYHSEDDNFIRNYCLLNGYNSRPVKFHRPFADQIRILVEKIFILKDFSIDQDVVLLDVDTAFKCYLHDSIWGSNPIVWTAEYYITQFRNLDQILPNLPWYETDIKFNDSFVMYNTGIVYIPKTDRKLVCENALWVVDRLNDGKDARLRYGNKLDEQIGLSIALCSKYSDIYVCHEVIEHFWEVKTKGIKWWETYQLTFPQYMIY